MHASRVLGPLMIVVLLATCARGQQVLCDRTVFATSAAKTYPSPTSFLNNEYVERPVSNFYILSGIVVPPGGWDINAVTVYFEKARKPAGWMRVARARLNLFRKSADLPLPVDDPRKGRVVDVKVQLEKECVSTRCERKGLVSISIPGSIGSVSRRSSRSRSTGLLYTSAPEATAARGSSRWFGAPRGRVAPRTSSRYGPHCTRAIWLHSTRRLPSRSRVDDATAASKSSPTRAWAGISGGSSTCALRSLTRSSVSLLSHRSWWRRIRAGSSSSSSSRPRTSSPGSNSPEPG